MSHHHHGAAMAEAHSQHHSQIHHDHTMAGVHAFSPNRSAWIVGGSTTKAVRHYIYCYMLGGLVMTILVAVTMIVMMNKPVESGHPHM